VFIDTQNTLTMAEEIKNAENIENNEEKLEQNEVEIPQEVGTEISQEIEVENPILEEEPKMEEVSEIEEVPVKKEVKKNHNPYPVQSLEDFNWEEIGKDQQIYSQTEQKHLEELYSQTFKSIIEQEVVDGIIVAITPREIVVNIGYKSDGVIPANELRHNPNLKIGDVIEVYVESQEDGTGQLILSHKKSTPAQGMGSHQRSV